MSARERLAVTLALVTVALFLPGYLLHAAPRFPGSLVGSLLGIAGALCFVILLAYSLAKRVPLLKKRIRLGAMLSLHVYAGAIGAVMAVLHTGHQYRSPLGIALVIVMLVVVLSGFVGRYYFLQVGTDLRKQQQELGALRIQYDRLLAEGSLAAGVRDGSTQDLSLGPVRALVAAIADLEHAVGRREALKDALSRWLVLHMVATLMLYPLLALHVWSGIYYGLRWLQ